MKLLTILAAVLALTSADKRCRGIFLDDQYFDLHILKEGISHLHDLAVNRRDNSVYFTFENVDGQKIPERLLGHIDMETKVAKVIGGIPNATAVAVDHNNNRVFVGGSNGLYKINDRGVPERLPIQDDVISMHYKNGLYFVNRRNDAYKFEDGFAYPITELKDIKVDRLIMDNDNNIFFTKDKKLFRVKLNTRAVNSHETHAANFIATDNFSKAYLCSDKGVYVYNRYKFVFDKVADLKNLKALAFHNMNEAVYAVADYIVKLSLNTLPCFED